MEPDMLAKDVIERWKHHKGTEELEEFWHQNAPEGAEFNKANAVAMVFTLLECYGNTLREIAEKGGPGAALATTALAYKPPVWS